MVSIFSAIGRASSLANSLKGLVVANDQTKISNLAIDCVHSEVLEYTNVITDHPVETKSSISDHIYSEPVTVTIDGTITDSSLKIFGIIETPLQKNSLSSIINNVKNLLPFSNSEKPSQVAFKILENICNTKQLVNVATKQKLYKNMAIEKLTITNDETTGHRLHFNCTLKQLTLASVQTTPYTRPIAKSTPNILPEESTMNEQTNTGQTSSKLKQFFGGTSSTESKLKSGDDSPSFRDRAFNFLENFRDGLKRSNLHAIP
jgi:hypothetical protein